LRNRGKIVKYPSGIGPRERAAECGVDAGRKPTEEMYGGGHLVHDYDLTLCVPTVSAGQGVVDRVCEPARKGLEVTRPDLAGLRVPMNGLWIPWP
jgi:hypothetical protein